MSPTQKKFLFTLLSQPTAPFREQYVAAQAIDYLTRNKIAHFKDPVGNIVIGVGSAADYKRLLKEKEQEPVRLFMAHMDHPGFHGQRWLSDKRLQVKWHGGTPVKHVTGASVYLADDDGRFAEGKLSKVKLVKAKWAMDTAEVVLAQAPEKENRLQSRCLVHSSSASLFGNRAKNFIPMPLMTWAVSTRFYKWLKHFPGEKRQHHL
jgi:endoglucanase